MRRSISKCGGQQIDKTGQRRVPNQNIASSHCFEPMLIHDRIAYSHIDGYVPTLPDTSRSIRLSSPHKQNVFVSFSIVWVGGNSLYSGRFIARHPGLTEKEVKRNQRISSTYEPRHTTPDPDSAPSRRSVLGRQRVAQGGFEDGVGGFEGDERCCTIPYEDNRREG